jgi:hypothetical protein
MTTLGSLFFSSQFSFRALDMKSVNLDYKTLVRWADGTNELSAKRLTFQVFSFHNFL